MNDEKDPNIHETDDSTASGVHETDLPPNAEEHIVEPENALPEVGLDAVPERLRQGAGRAGWTALMPVQSKAIPYMLAKRDLMIQSRTGSGKTGAYLLPFLERLDPDLAACQALILVPTRELAHQVTKEAGTVCGTEGGLRSVSVYGGAAYGPQIDALKKGAHIVVGTPGRILDHLIKGTLNLSKLRILVLDEADRMLSMGFYPDMRRIQSFLPKRPVNGYMFSATFPPHVMRLSGLFLRKPEFLSLSRDRVYVAGMDHVYYIVPPMKKDRSLVKIIEVENPVSAIIFCNMKSTVHYVSVVLQRFGYDADELSADLSQAAREHVMARIKKGQLRFLVATDVAARGIDIPELSHVIQYEPGEDPESYIHRAGRTGRAGAGGQAITLVAGMEEIKLKEVAEQYDIDLQERPVPTDEDVENIVAQRVTAMLEADLRARDNLQVERMRRFVPLARSLGQIEDESGLVAMLLDDYYQKTLHAAPEVAGPEEEERPSSRLSSRPPRQSRGSGGDRSGPRRRRRPPRKRRD